MFDDVRVFSSINDLITHYSAVRKRINPFKAEPAKAIEIVPKPVPLPPAPPKPFVMPIITMSALKFQYDLKDVTGFIGPTRTSSQIIGMVAHQYGVLPSEICGPKRQKHVTVARFAAMWHIRQERNLSYHQIGALFWLRDHTTVLHAIKMHEARHRAQNDRMTGKHDAG